MLMKPLSVESSVIVIFYVIFLMRSAVIIILEKHFFPISRKQGVNNCFKPLIMSVFTTAAFRLKSEQKEKEKQILKLDITFSIQQHFIK